MERLGQFYISKQLVEEGDTGIAKALALLAFVPVRVEYLWGREAYLYLGHSPHFRELGVNEQTPEYEITVHGEFNEEQKRSVPVRVWATELKAIDTGPVTEAERAEVFASVDRYLNRIEKRVDLEMLNVMLGGESNGNEKQPG